MKTNHLTRAALLLSFAALSPLVHAEPTAESPQLIEKPVVAPGSLTAVITDSTTFSTLKKALKAAELDITLGTKGEYTVFAPTDEAFGKLPPAVLTKLLLPENKEKLRSLLLYHVLPGKVTAAELKDGELKTMNGEKIKVAVAGTSVEVEGAKVFSADVMANNGVMHSIGTVLIPKSLDGFAGLDK
jgi:uncharacterized surface protein with fasciclin (FAS1) repeats